MDNNIENRESVYIDDPTIYNKKIEVVKPQSRNIGIDVSLQFVDNIINAGLNSTLDTTKLQSFTQLSLRRDTIYLLLDTMSEDPTISAALEIYAEDSTETNDEGRVVWCESDDAEIVKFVTFLLDTMNVDKNIYRWVYSLCKYGDLYLRLFHESEMDNDSITKDVENAKNQKSKNSNKKDTLNEAIKFSIANKNDHLSHYVEMVPNPAEMFELTRHGKTCGYIQADVMPTQLKVDFLYGDYFRYSFKQKDVTVYEATNFVHAALEDNSSRTPEEVNLFLGDTIDDNSPSVNYIVKRGQPIFYNAFKVWRCIMLLENSLLLNRITKSSILRIIGVEVGDMDKTQVGPHLMNIKLLIELKSAIDVGTSMEEYTNPGPVENNIYVPTHNGIGSISTLQVGGDVDVKSLADLDYFKDRFYTALRIPKQYLGDTDDATGFNGGTALSIISNRYAKMIKRILNVVILCITDAVNLMLLDKQLDSYVNKFELHMLPPATEEDATRRDNQANEIQVIRDIMDLLGDVEDSSAKLEILKILLSNVISDSDILQILSDEVERLEAEGAQDTSSEESPENDDIDISINERPNFGSSPDINTEIDNMSSENEEQPEDQMILPTPNQLNPDIDFSDNTSEL